MPVLLTHGWPGSFAEYTGLLDQLTRPPGNLPAFHVILPSIPGFGFSGPTSDAGWDLERVARAWAVLTQQLGYDRFLAHGGDWGAGISHSLARLIPDRLIGVHLTSMLTAVPRLDLDAATLPGSTPEEHAIIAQSQRRRRSVEREEMGYRLLQSTRPQTLAYALADSPAGQLAWIIEKFHGWTDNQGSPEDAIDRDTLLTNVSIYWFTNTAGSSARIYYETAHSPQGRRIGFKPSSVPTAVAVFASDLSLPVRRFAAATDNIIRWTSYERGGHFAALEQPGLLVADLRAFASDLGRQR
jgi:pimeloyl-ACP methyl ester carboxylesterase